MQFLLSCGGWKGRGSLLDPRHIWYTGLDSKDVSPAKTVCVYFKQSLTRSSTLKIDKEPARFHHQSRKLIRFTLLQSSYRSHLYCDVILIDEIPDRCEDPRASALSLNADLPAVSTLRHWLSVYQSINTTVVREQCVNIIVIVYVWDNRMYDWGWTSLEYKLTSLARWDERF